MLGRGFGTRPQDATEVATALRCSPLNDRKRELCGGSYPGLGRSSSRGLNSNCRRARMLSLQFTPHACTCKNPKYNCCLAMKPFRPPLPIQSPLQWSCVNVQTPATLSTRSSVPPPICILLGGRWRPLCATTTAVVVKAPLLSLQKISTLARLLRILYSVADLPDIGTGHDGCEY